MVSFGMPYMEVFNESGKRLFIKNSNSATLETKIENYDNIIKDVGEEKIALMLKKSSEDGISITSKYLSDNFITHPPF
jgi:carbamoylphosphate synthase large subunit